MCAWVRIISLLNNKKYYIHFKKNFNQHSNVYRIGIFRFFVYRASVCICAVFMSISYRDMKNFSIASDLKFLCSVFSRDTNN